MNTERGTLGQTSLMMLPVLSGLAASTILLLDYLAPAPVFCDAHSGCAALKKTAFASLLGIPTPVFGVVGFILLGIIALMRGPKVRAALFYTALPAALLGAFFIAFQVRASTYCKYCLTADISICVLLAVATWRKLGAWDPPRETRTLVAWAGGMVLAVGSPSTAAYRQISAPVPLPDAVAREIAKSPKGKVTIVDFVDYECPFCRMAQTDLAPALAKYADRVRVVHKNVPLPHLHPHAMDAAKAACCGELLGAGDEMADRLFSLPPDELTPEGCAKVAESLGLSERDFRSCVVAPETESRIRADMAEFKSVGGRGLPLMWIEQERFEGYESGTRLEDAIVKAIAKRRS